MFCIYAYKVSNRWFFDDPVKDIHREEFIRGMDLILDEASKAHSNAHLGLVIHFDTSDSTLDHEMIKVNEIDNGAMYKHVKKEMTGWLCPVMFKYFDKAPDKIYFSIEKDCLSIRLWRRLFNFN